MAVIVYTKRNIVCDGCGKDITPVEDCSADTLRFKHKIKPYRGEDLCDICHPIPREKRGKPRWKRKVRKKK